MHSPLFVFSFPQDVHDQVVQMFMKSRLLKALTQIFAQKCHIYLRWDVSCLIKKRLFQNPLLEP